MSQNADIAEVKARILEIAALCTGIVTVGHQYTAGGKYQEFTADQLLAVTTYYTGTTRRERKVLTLGAGSRQVTRIFDVVLHVALLAEKPTNAQEQAAIEAAEAVVDVLPNHFALYPTLEFEDDGGVVYATGEMLDDGGKLFAYGGAWYGAITYKLPVVTFT